MSLSDVTLRVCPGMILNDGWGKVCRKFQARPENWESWSMFMPASRKAVSHFSSALVWNTRSVPGEVTIQLLFMISFSSCCGPQLE